MMCVSRVCHIYPKNLAYVPKNLWHGDFLCFSLLNLSKWILKVKPVILNNILLHLCQVLRPSWTDSPVIFQASQRSQGPLSLLLGYRREKSFQLSRDSFGSREDDWDIEKSKRIGKL